MSRRDLEHELRQALAQDTLGVAYQPIMRLSDGRVHGVEALLRWSHPTDGPVPALTAITLAEQHGLIGEVGRWVLRRACEDHVRWTREQLHDQPGRALALSVNISVHQLMADGFVASTLGVLDQTGMPPALLLLEITESVFIHDAERAAQVIADLRGSGIGVALDDFGTGYSSLAYLRRFPVDLLKIDQSFVDDIGLDAAATAIVQSVISLASGLGLSVIAEGVQTERQRDLLTVMGCQLAQGFLFHPALPARAVAKHLART